MQKSTNFTEGKVALPLVKFAIPILLAMLLQSFYGAVDMIIIGNFGTTADVSAVNTASWITATVSQVFTGLSMGTTILLGQRIGMKKTHEIGDIIGTGICLFAILGIAVSILLYIFASPIAVLMNAPEEAFEGTVTYLQICGGGLIFIVAYNLLGGLFRGMGNSKVPLISVAIATVLNIIGDLWLIAGCHMGVAGAAIATVAAQAVSVVISLIVVKVQGFPYPFGLKNIRINKTLLKETLSLGVPTALQDILISISFLVVNAIVNSLGVTASAGVGVAERWCSFIMLVPSTFMQTMSAFTAQNIGAGKWSRAYSTLKKATAVSLCVGFAIGLLTFLFGDTMSSWFAPGKTEVIADAYLYLKAYAVDTLIVSAMFCYVGFFNGCGRTKFVMLQGIMGAFLVRIPFSILMKKVTLGNLFWIGMATPCSSLLQIILCFIYMHFVKKQMKKNPEFT